MSELKRKVAVVTDSTSSLTQAMGQEYGVHSERANTPGLTALKKPPYPQRYGGVDFPLAPL